PFSDVVLKYLQFIDDNDLGRGIKLGGTIEGKPLYLVTSDWGQHREHIVVKSGWLYQKLDIPGITMPSDVLQSFALSPSLAVAFFKIHLINNGSGYIHLLDAANPTHTLWLETDMGYRREEVFCWDADASIQRTALW